MEQDFSASPDYDIVTIPFLDLEDFDIFAKMVSVTQKEQLPNFNIDLKYNDEVLGNLSVPYNEKNYVYMKLQGGGNLSWNFIGGVYLARFEDRTILDITNVVLRMMRSASRHMHTENSVSKTKAILVTLKATETPETPTIHKYNHASISAIQMTGLLLGAIACEAGRNQNGFNNCLATLIRIKFLNKERAYTIPSTKVFSAGQPITLKEALAEYFFNDNYADVKADKWRHATGFTHSQEIIQVASGQAKLVEYKYAADNPEAWRGDKIKLEKENWLKRYTGNGLDQAHSSWGAGIGMLQRDKNHIIFFSKEYIAKLVTSSMTNENLNTIKQEVLVKKSFRHYQAAIQPEHELVFKQEEKQVPRMLNEKEVNNFNALIKNIENEIEQYELLFDGDEDKEQLLAQIKANKKTLKAFANRNLNPVQEKQLKSTENNIDNVTFDWSSIEHLINLESIQNLKLEIKSLDVEINIIREKSEDKFSNNVDYQLSKIEQKVLARDDKRAQKKSLKSTDSSNDPTNILKKDKNEEDKLQQIQQLGLKIRDLDAKITAIRNSKSDNNLENLQHKVSKRDMLRSQKKVLKVSIESTVTSTASNVDANNQSETTSSSNTSGKGLRN